MAIGLELERARLAAIALFDATNAVENERGDPEQSGGRRLRNGFDRYAAVIGAIKSPADHAFKKVLSDAIKLTVALTHLGTPHVFACIVVRTFYSPYAVSGCLLENLYNTPIKSAAKSPIPPTQAADDPG